MDSSSDIKIVVSREFYHDLSDWAKFNLTNDMIFNVGENRMEIITRGSNYKMELEDAEIKLSQSNYLKKIKKYFHPSSFTH